MYWLILFLTLYGVFRFDIGKKESGGKYLFNTILFLVVIASSIAYLLGSDCPYYQYVFENYIPSIFHLNKDALSHLDKSFNIGFILFMSLCKTIIPSFYFFKLVYACILNITIFSFIRKNTKYIYLVLLFYFMQEALYFNFEVMREALAVCVFLWAYPYIKKKQLVKYYLLCLLAFSFHGSAIVLFLVPFILLLKVGTRNSMITISIVIVVLAVISVQFGEIIHPFMNAFDATFNKEYTNYLMDEKFGSGVSILSNLYSLFVDIAMPLIMLYLISNKKGVKDYYPVILILPVFILLSNSIFFFYRFLNYFMVFRFLFYVEIFEYFGEIIVKKKNSLVFVVICFLYLGSIFIKNDLAVRDNGYRNIDRYYPYATIFQDSSNPARVHHDMRQRYYQ